MLGFIEAHRDGPFYINLWSLVPHATLNPTAEQMAPYARLGPGGADFPYKGAMQIFCASVTDLDTQVGRLLGRLVGAGLVLLVVAASVVAYPLFHLWRGRRRSHA